MCAIVHGAETHDFQLYRSDSRHVDHRCCLCVIGASVSFSLELPTYSLCKQLYIELQHALTTTQQAVAFDTRAPAPAKPGRWRMALELYNRRKHLTFRQILQLQQFTQELGTGIVVVKHRRSLLDAGQLAPNKRGAASKLLWMDASTRRICIDNVNTNKRNPRKKKGTQLADVGDVRPAEQVSCTVPTDQTITTATYMQFIRTCCVIVSVSRTFDIEFESQERRDEFVTGFRLMLRVSRYGLEIDPPQ